MLLFSIHGKYLIKVTNVKPLFIGILACCDILYNLNNVYIPISIFELLNSSMITMHSAYYELNLRQA